MLAKQPSIGVLIKRCSYIPQIYRRMPTSAWAFCKFAEYFWNTFSKEKLWKAGSGKGQPYGGEPTFSTSRTKFK